MVKIIKKKFKLPISKMVGVPNEIELNVIEDNDTDKVKRRKENMIKIDYEGAWKDLKKIYGSRYIHYDNINYQKTISCAMEEFEQKHTHNYIDIKRRSDKEVADYCLKKHAEVYLELVELKSKLKKLAENIRR